MNNHKTEFTYIVLGCGGIGSAALYWLSTLAPGQEILGIERFELGHHNGGSQDHSRIIRLSYDEQCYTSLAPHMYTAWKAVEDESGVQLVLKTGALVFGPKTGPHVDKYISSMRSQGIPHTVLSGGEVRKRFPQFNLTEDDHAVYQADGGLVDARKGNAAHIALARARGVSISDNTMVQLIQPLGKEGAKVVTNKGTFSCKKLIMATGAWTKDLVNASFGLNLPLHVTQEQVNYYHTNNLRAFSPERFPVWISYYDNKCFYGFPVYGEVATKAGLDCGGEVVTASTRTFTPDKKAEETVTTFLKHKIPESADHRLFTKTCLYCLTPDRHFIIDKLPAYPQVSVFVGAGHAYKWASLIGLILAQIAVTGHTTYPIDAFRITRPALLNATQNTPKL